MKPEMPLVVIMLPQPLSLGGVTTWAGTTADVLSVHGHSVAVLAPPFVNQSHAAHVSHPGTRTDPAFACIDDNDSIRRAASAAYEHVVGLVDRADRQIVLMPQLSGACLASAACLAHRLSQQGRRVRVAGWMHTVTRYDGAMLARFAPTLSAIGAVSSAAGQAARETIASLGTDAVGSDAPPIAIVRTCVPNVSIPPARGGFGDPVRLIYTGRLAHDKGVRALPPMMHELARLGLNARLTILGDGVDRDVLARTPGIEQIPDVPRRDLPSHLAAHDFFVLPSRAEGLGLSRIEAALAGCVPVVLEHSGGALEGITHGTSGLVAPIESNDRFDDERVGTSLAHTIADAVRTLDAEGADAVRCGSRRAALAMFGLEASGAALAAFVEQLLHEPAPIEAWADIERNPEQAARFTVPTDATDRVIDAMRAINALEPARCVAWFGAGAHARHLLSADAFPKELLPAALIDDDPAAHTHTINGVAVAGPERIPELGITDLLLTSWLHHADLWNGRARFERLGVRVHPVYPIQASSNAATTDCA